MGGSLAEWQKAGDPRLAHMDRVFSRFAQPGALPWGARPASAGGHPASASAVTLSAKPAPRPSSRGGRPRTASRPGTAGSQPAGSRPATALSKLSVGGRPPAGPGEAAKRPASASVADPEEAKRRAAKAAQRKKQREAREAVFYTSNKLSYGASEIDPELYRSMQDVVRPIRAPNVTLRSEWGESLAWAEKQRAKKTAGAQKQSQTTYDRLNDSVYPEFLSSRNLQNDQFFEWVRRQRLYYGDILSEEATQAVDEWLDQASDEERQEFLELFRDLHVAHTSEMLRSISHQDYSKYNPDRATFAKRPSSAPFAEGSRPMTAEQLSRPGTGGVRPPPAVRPATGSRPATADPSRRPSTSAGVRKIKPTVEASGDGPPKIEIETFSSQVPLQWGGSGLAPTSTYTDTYRKGPAYATAEDGGGEEDRMLGYWAAVTAPFGSLNPKFYKHEGKTNYYPIPEALMYPKGLIGGAPPRGTQTTNRMSFLPRSEEELIDQAKKAAEQVAASKAARYITTVPLGAQGIMSLPRLKDGTHLRFGTTYKEFHEQTDKYENDVGRSVEEAKRNKMVHKGITAPIGGTAPANTQFMFFE